MDNSLEHRVYIADMRSIGSSIIKNTDSWCDFKGRSFPDSPDRNVLALALALLEGANLFAILDSSKPRHIKSLFDGGEATGPNIDTRLRTIRDLCSASTYMLNAKSSQTASNSGHIYNRAHSKDPDNWLKGVVSTSCLSREGDVVELWRLLEDVYVSLTQISSNLRFLQQKEDKALWNEVYRHVCHIRDHFDYAEGIVIACIVPSPE